MELDARLLFQIGAVIASLSGAWALVRSQVNTLKQIQEEQKNYVDELNRELDEVENAVSVLRSQITVLSGILSPDNLKEQNKWRGTFSEKVQQIEKDIDILQHMHNGRHPDIKQAS
jgi:SMC interacting uncharacterized protein involved in chromosome segregation